MPAVILDANLLLLLVVGKTSDRYIENHKRLGEYSSRDFITLTNFLSKSPGLIVTPNTLTEVSNLADWIAEPARGRIAKTLRELVQASQRVDERTVASAVAMNRSEFLRLGLTDSVLLDLASRKSMILTSDLNLYLAAVRAGYPATNFNHLRDL